jgi:hypothetical protein
MIFPEPYLLFQVMDAQMAWRHCRNKSHKPASTRGKVLKPSRFPRSPMRVQHLLRTSCIFPGILEYVNVRSQKICGWPIPRHSLYCYMCSTSHNYITNRCLQADGHRYCIQHPKRNFSVPQCKHISMPGTSHFPVTGCISLEKQPYPPFTLNPFTLVQQLYSLPTIHIPFPWLPNPRCLYTRWSSRFQWTTEIVLFILDKALFFEKLITAKLIKKFATFFFWNLNFLRHIHKNFHILPRFQPHESTLDVPCVVTEDYCHLWYKAIKDSLVITNISEEPSASICKVKYALDLLLSRWIIIIIIFMNCSWVVTRRQWSFYIVW